MTRQRATRAPDPASAIRAGPTRGERVSDFGEFASVIAHELRSPIGLAAGAVEVLQEQHARELPEEVRALVGHAEVGLRRARGLLDALQYYARTERAVLRRETVDCAALVDDVVGELSREIEHRGARVQRGCLPVVMGDRVQLEQLFFNLLANAIKFNDSSSPTVGIEGAPTDSHWAFAVSDNGLGVEPQMRSRIFQMFERGHPAGAFEGSGVGLAVCGRIVERHGGRIWVEPAPLRGSVFRFTVARSAGES
jgi:signal transduction histidine kinase